jgi:hypothetical protein
VGTSPRYLVLDFTRVPSIDATMVHSCFTPIARLTKSLDCQLVYAGCNSVVSAQLKNHGAFEGDHIRIFRTVHRALDWCETSVIAGAQRRLHRSSTNKGNNNINNNVRGKNHSPTSSSNSLAPPPPPAPSAASFLSVFLPQSSPKSPPSGGKSAAGAAGTKGRVLSMPNAGDSGQKALELTTSAFESPASASNSSNGGGSGSGSPQSPQSPRRGSAKTAEERTTVKVATLLRQWLELRPQAPPARVRPWLYLGGAHHACDRALLRQLNVRYVLNVADDVPNFFEDEELGNNGGGGSSSSSSSSNDEDDDDEDDAIGSEDDSESDEFLSEDDGGGLGFASSAAKRNSSVKKRKKKTKRSKKRNGAGRGGRIEYFNLHVADYGQDLGISRVFSEAFEFAARARAKGARGGSNLLVHCRFGMNRSPTVVMALLMTLEDLSLAEAWKQLKSIHAEAYPQRDNRRELVRFERLRNEAKVAALRQHQQRKKEAEEQLDGEAFIVGAPGGEKEGGEENGGRELVDAGNNSSGGGLLQKGDAGLFPLRIGSVDGADRDAAAAAASSSSSSSSSAEGGAQYNSMGPEDFHAHDPNDDAERMQRYCRTESFSADEVIFDVGDYAEDLFILLGGSVDLVDADGNLELTLSPGNVFGFVDSQLGKPRSTSAHARSQEHESMQPLHGGHATASAASSAAAVAGGAAGAGGVAPGSAEGAAADGAAGGSEEWVVRVAAISMASLERMSSEQPRIAIKLMKVLLRQSSMELSNVRPGAL